MDVTIEFKSNKLEHQIGASTYNSNVYKLKERFIHYTHIKVEHNDVDSGITMSFSKDGIDFEGYAEGFDDNDDFIIQAIH